MSCARNPDLLIDDVWRIFEVEGGGENSLAAHDKYCPDSVSWRAALVELSNDGALSRERLLDTSLDALQRGFAQFRAQWYSALHEALRPTDDERRGAGEHLPLAHREPRRAYRLDGAEGASAGRADDSPRRGRSRGADRAGDAGSEQGFRHPGARTLGTRGRLRARSPAPSRKPRRRSTRSWER